VKSIKHSDGQIAKELVTDKTISAIGFLINELREKYNLDYEKIMEAVSEKQKESELNFIPLDILNERPLGILETIVKFLKEERNFSFNQIAKLLQRDNRTIWASYHNALKKKSKRFVVKKDGILVPIETFSKRELGMLESLSVYLKEKRSMNFHEIGVALKRNERTIWTSYHQGKKKRRSE
jgi:hypothetical protein